MTAGSPTPDSWRPARRVLLLQALLDLLLFSLPVLAAVAAVSILALSSGRALVNREDRWRFDGMPASEDALLGWSRGQSDVRNFRAERVPGVNQLVLRYDRASSKGPAHPDWELLGYRMAYLASATSVETPFGMPSLLGLWLGTIGVYLAGGGVALFRIRSGLRAGVRLISPADPPRQGWLRWLLLACVMLVALDLAQGWLLRMLHIDQNPQRILQSLRNTSGLAMWIAAASVVLMAPIAEELIFRGCMFGRFQAYGYGVSGAVVSALLFAAVHGILALLPIFFGIGILLAWLCRRTGSLWPGMALHALNNGVALIAIFWAKP